MLAAWIDQVRPRSSNFFLSVELCALLPFLFSCAPPQGAERGACYPNGTCDKGLICASDLCVKEPNATRDEPVGDGDGDTSGDGDGDGDTTGDGDGDVGGDGDGDGDGDVVETGWTEFAPSDDTQTIYVSSSEGTDGNDGLSPDTPLETLGAAIAATRPGYPDHVLLKRGDTWENQNISFNGHGGRSPEEPLVVSAYGDESEPRPRILTGTRNGVEFSANQEQHYIAVTDLYFEAHYRNPNHPAYNPGANNFNDANGVYATTLGSHLHFEGNRFAWFTSGIIVQAYPFETGIIDDVTIRRNVITDIYTTGPYSQGMYYYDVDHLTVEENVIDHTGAIEEVGKDGTIYDHSGYFQNGVVGANTTVRGNIITRGDGIQLREGGVAEDNLFARTWIALHCGGGNNANPDGVNCQLHDNVILEGDDINAVDQRGWGLRILNLGADGGSAITGNVIANNEEGHFPLPIQLDGVSGFDNGHQSQIHGLLLADNVVYNWGGFTYIQGDGSEIQDVEMVGNVMVNATTEPLLSHNNAGQLAGISSGDNQIWNSSGDENTMCAVDFTPVPFADWQTDIGDTTSTVAEPSFPDPERSLARYQEEVLGGSGGFEGFIEAARENRKGQWDEALTAAAVNDWIREGFGITE